MTCGLHTRFPLSSLHSMAISTANLALVDFQFDSIPCIVRTDHVGDILEFVVAHMIELQCLCMGGIAAINAPVV